MRHLAVLCVLVGVSAGCRKNAEEPVDEGGAAQLTLVSPEAASWHAEGPVVVSGRAERLSGITVNGVAAEQSGGDFSAPLSLVRGINQLEARGQDARGHGLFERHAVLAGSFADPGRPIEEAAGVRLNRGGLDALLEVVGGWVEPALINDSLDAINPVYEEEYAWDSIRVSADLGSIDFGPVLLQALPASGVLDLRVVLPELEVWVPSQGSVLGVGFGVDVWMGATSAEITGLVTAQVVDGALQTQLVTPDVKLHGFWYDVSLLPWGIESWLLVDTVRGALEGALVDQISEMVPAMLDEQLGALDLSFQGELLGKELSVVAGLHTVSIDHDGLLLLVDLDVNLPGAGAQAYKGYLSAGTGRPRPDRESDLSVVLSDDLLNRVLFEAWRAGMLSQTLSSDDGTLEPALLSQLGARKEATVVLDARLPPVVVPTPGGLQAQIGELEVTILTPGGERGERLDLAVTAWIHVDLAVKKGELALGLRDPELSITVRDSDWGASNQAISNLLEDQLPIGVLLMLLGDFTIPLPELGGLTLGETEVSREASGRYTAIQVDLNP